MLFSDPQHYITGVRKGDRRILSKTITLIESVHPDHRKMALEVTNGLFPFAGNAIRVGITGVPGVGKSTFIESFGLKLTQMGYTVAVLAVDPSSRRSGGSILGDKTRMEQLAVSANAYIRPSPSGGTLGGVARKTRESMLICEAAGFDVIIVETVGVGQSEITVASMVDFFLVLMLAGAGDELQGIKKGVLEIADAICINKADGDNLFKARQARKEYETALHLLKPVHSKWSPPALICSALTNDGLDEIWETILDFKAKLSVGEEFSAKRKAQALDWMWSLIEEGLKELFYSHENVSALLPDMAAKVEKGSILPTQAAIDLLKSMQNVLQSSSKPRCSAGTSKKSL